MILRLVLCKREVFLITLFSFGKWLLKRNECGSKGRKPNNRNCRFNGKLRLTQYAGEPERERE